MKLYCSVLKLLILMVIVDKIHVIKQKQMKNDKNDFALQSNTAVYSKQPVDFFTTQTLCICNVSVMYIGMYICDMLTVNLVHM